MRKEKSGAIILTALLLLSQVQLLGALQTVELGNLRRSRVRMNILKQKTLKIELSDSLVSELGSNEQTLFYKIATSRLAEVVVSSRRKAHNEDLKISHLIDKNGDEVSSFTGSSSRIWDDVKDTKVLFITISNEEQEQALDVDIELVVSDAYYIDNLQEYNFETQKIFDTVKNKRVPIKFKYKPKSKDAFLKIIAITSSGNENLVGYGDLSPFFEGKMPTEKSSDFVLMKFKETIYAHVLDTQNSQVCYNGECTVKMVFELEKGTESFGLFFSEVENYEVIPGFTLNVSDIR